MIYNWMIDEVGENWKIEELKIVILEDPLMKWINRKEEKRRRVKRKRCEKRGFVVLLGNRKRSPYHLITLCINDSSLCTCASSLHVRMSYSFIHSFSLSISLSFLHFFFIVTFLPFLFYYCFIYINRRIHPYFLWKQLFYFKFH